MPAPAPLDAGPPLPPGLAPGTGGQPTPKPSLDQMAGKGGQKPEGQAGSPQEAAIQHLMAAEASMDAAANIIQGLAPIVDDIKNQMHARLGKVLMGSSPSTPVAGSLMGASMPGAGQAIGGMVQSPAMPPAMGAT